VEIAEYSTNSALTNGSFVRLYGTLARRFEMIVAQRGFGIFPSVTVRCVRESIVVVFEQQKRNRTICVIVVYAETLVVSNGRGELVGHEFISIGSDGRDGTKQASAILLFYFSRRTCPRVKCSEYPDMSSGKCSTNVTRTLVGQIS
jgi:hypothetical protein